MKEDLIDKVGKRVPYEVPSGYLENFTSGVLDTYKLRRLKFRKRMKLFYYAAAILLVFLIPGYIFIAKESKKSNETLNSFIISDNLSKSIENLSDDELIQLSSALDSDIYNDQIQ